MAFNYGLLSTAAQGIKEGMAAYQTSQQMKRNNQLMNLAYGLQQDEGGNLSYTPDKQAEIDNERKAKAAQAGGLLSDYAPSTAEEQGVLKRHRQMAGLNDSVDLSGLTHHQIVEQEGLLAPDVKGSYEVKAAGAKATALGSDDTPKNINQRLKEMDTAIDPNKGRAGLLAKSQAMSNSADRIDAILRQFPDGNIPKAQTHELATAQAAMVAGGSPQSQKQIDDVTPSSLRGNAEGIEGWLNNNPKGLQQQAYIKALADSTHREKDVALDQLHEAQVEDLGPYVDLANKPFSKKRYQGILDKRHLTPDMFDEKGAYVPSDKRHGMSVQPPPPPKPGDIQDGYIFKGGDPSDQKNWKQQ